MAKSASETAANRTVWTDFLGAAREHLQGVEWTMNGTLSMLRRRWPVLATCMGLCLGLAILILLVVPSTYTATALLQINTRQEQVTKIDDVVSGLAATDPAIRTEVDVLTSRRLAERVVKKLQLINNPDFLQNTSVLGELKHAVVYFLFPFSNSEERAEAEAAERDLATRKAVNILLDNLNVQVKPRSFTIVVTFNAHSPELASKVANAIAAEYLTSQLEDKFDATKRANDWMNDRLKQMQRDVQTAQLAVERFREQHGLTEAKGVLLSDQQISDLNSQLILSRTQLAEAQAKFDRTKQLQSSGRGIDTATEVLNSPLIMNLRQQEAEIRRNMSDLASRYGERHPRMLNVRNELRDLQRKIYEEITKIQGSLENEVAVAEARVKTLAEQLEALQAKTSLSTDANVQLSELERQLQAEKTLYENFLGRSKEIAQMDMTQTDARVISQAEVPMQASSPKKGMTLLLALLAGGALGIALMLLLEMLDGSYRTAQQLEMASGVPVLGMLGELPHDMDVAHYVVDKPTGAFTEGVRAARTALNFANPDKKPQVLLITSTVPQEGKSLFSISIAQLAAAGGAKVLLVDADLRRPSVSKQLGLTPKAGLAEVLADTAKLKSVILTLPKSGLEVMPALPNTQFAQELLSSKKMKDLMAAWRKDYDLIVIDSPPVMAVADTITLSTMADALLFMVRWGTTPRQLVLNAVKQLKNCNTPLAGCMLTRVDLEKQQAYGYGDYGYYYGKYKEYYND
ncbi:MAG: polysaccharide biosynthesis tyrosine autokinase [Proteobacteria bacterium]|nr:polysaccharide biosynthesis tyrosine autokinase [Pseudomonadota bacterium]